jgi:uncharacterized protein YndB with AHSA1/START domain
MPDIKHLIEIAATPSAVYAALTTSAGLQSWWTADAEAETQAGGAAQFGFFQRTTVYRMRIDQLEPARRVAWTCETGAEWQGTSLVFSLEAKGAGTLLHFVHGNWQAESEYFLCCNTTWGELLYRLKAAVEGHGRGPLFTLDGLAA